MLLERDSLIAALGELAGGLDEGRGKVVAIAGEAGIGKSALVDAFAATVRGRRRVLIGWCDALVTPQPLSPLFDVFRQLGVDATELLTETRPRDELFQLLVDHLERAATVMIVEDIHWADEATLDLLKFLGRRAARLPLLLMITFRDDELRMREKGPFLTGEIPPSSLVRFTLPPLSESAISSLAGEKDVDASTLLRVTGGNPFFVTELLANPEVTVPGSVRDAVLRRASALSPAARETLEILAIVPSRLERSLARAIGAAEAPFDECIAAGVIRQEGSEVMFRHEIARRAIAEATRPGRRRDLHRAALAFLISRPSPDLARIVHHAVEAEDDYAILQWAPKAADAAARLGAHREAAEHLRLALRSADLLAESDRASLLERLSYECYLTDAISSAFQYRMEALEIRRRLGDRLRQGDDHRWCSRLLWFTAQRNDSLDHARRAIDILEEMPAGPELAMAYSNRAQLHMLAGEVEDAVAWGTRAIDLARLLGNPEIESHALNNVGTALAARGTGDGMLEKSLVIALEHDLQEHAARAFTNLSSTSIQARRYGEARAQLERGLDYCEQRDLDAWTLYMRGWRARLLLDTGDWTGATVDALRVIGHPRTSAVSRITPLVVLGIIRARRGDPGSLESLEEARSLAATSEEVQRIAPVAFALAESDWLRGDEAGARARLADLSRFTISGLDTSIRGELACWKKRLGADDFERGDDLTPPHGLELSGDPSAAAAAWEEIGCTPEAALTLAFSDDPALVTRALALAGDLGAPALAARIRDRLRRLGARVPGAPRRSTRSNSAGLTSRQMDVLRLVAQGLRNQEIAERLHLTSKTVDHHVSAVLGKLNARSRLEASRLAQERGLL